MKLFRLSLTVLLTIVSLFALAADRYWIASSVSNWNNTANWSTTWGGASGASVPGFSDIVYFDANGTGTCTLDVNASVDAVNMSAGTLNTSTFTFTISGTSYSTFSGGTINGNNTFNIHPTGTAGVTFSGTTFNPAVDVVSPRIFLNGSTFNGVSSFEKTGTSNDAGIGGNTFVGNCTIKNTGSRYLLLGNGGNDSFSGNLDIINSGSSIIYLAYNNSTTTVGGNLTVSNSGSATNIGIAYIGASSINITGNCTINNSSSATARIYLGNNGSFTVGGTLDITNGGTGSSSIYLANGTTSSATISGATTIVNNDTATAHRIYLGYQGDVTFNGVLNIKNNSNANNSQIYCNSAANSTNSYNENIVVEVTAAGSDGILFGAGNGSGTLAATKTITIGSNGYISGDLQFRNFTQTGSTAQTLTTTGTTRLYCYDSDWGGNTDFESPRIVTRGTTYNGTTKLEATGSSNNQSYGDNIFTGNTEIINSGSSSILMGVGGTDDFQGNLTLNNTGSGGISIAYRSPATTNIAGTFIINNISATNSGNIFVAIDSISSVVVGGNTTITNSGAGAQKRIFMGRAGDITFNGTVTVHNSSSSTYSPVSFNTYPESHNIFNENIIIESSHTNSDGVQFGLRGGSATLAAGKTITVGGAGFIAGQLTLRNFTQTGNTAQSLTLTGTGYFTSYNSNWGGNVSFTAGRMNTRGTTYNGTVYLEKTGADNNYSHGGNIFKANTELKNSGSGQFIMGNSISDDFQANLILRNTGSSNLYIANNSAGNQIANDLTIYNSGHYVYVNNSGTASTTIGGNCTVSQTGSASNSRVYLNDDGTLTISGTLDLTTNTSGSAYLYVSANGTSSTTIGGATTVTNNGTGTISRIYLGNAGDITFNGTLTIHNNSGSANSSVFLNDDNLLSHNDYNENIIVESSIANCDGVLFGYGGGTGTLAAGKTITIGGAGFISGQLYLRNFTQTGATAQTLTTTGTANIYNYDSDWGGNVVFTAPSLIIRGTNYQGTAFLEKTGSSNDAGAGGNTFHQSVTFKNSGTGSLILGNGASDSFLSNVTLENVGSNDISFARGGLGHSIAGNLTINNTGSDGDIYLADLAGSSLSVSGNTTVVNSGAGTYHRIYLGNRGSVSFTGTLDISNSSTATNSAVYLNNTTGSNNTYAQNITIENTNAASDGILFGYNGGTGVLAASKTISIKAGGFIAGQLYFRNFTQTGATAHTLIVTADADMVNNSSDWGGDVIFKSPRMYVSGTTFRGTAYLEKTGAGNDNSTGGNTFMGNVEFVNSSSGYLYLGSGTFSSFQANVTLTNSGTNNLTFARSGAGHAVTGNLIINNTSNGGQVSIADQSTASLTIGGNTTVINSGSGTNHRIYLGNDGDVVFNGDIDISNSSDATNSTVYIGENLTNSQITMNGDLSVENTNSASDGIYITPQAATLASGKTISLKAGGFIAGIFRIQNLSQLGTNPISLTLKGTSYLQNYTSSWGGNVSFTAPRVFFRGNTFNGTAYLEKTGATDDQSYGGNTFKENTHLVNNSSAHYFMMSGTDPDDFQKNLIMDNLGGDDMFLGNNASGIQVLGNLTITNTARNIYLANGAASSLSIGGNTSITNNSALAASATIFGSNGDVTATGTVSFINNASGASNQMYIANGSNSNVVINNNVSINNQSGGTTKRVYIGNTGTLTLNGTLDIVNTSTATNSQIYCNQGTSCTVNYNGNITVSASGSNCDGIFFGSGNGAGIIANGATISIGGGGFTDGQLYLRNLTQNGATAQSLSLTSNGYLTTYNSTWNGNITFVAPRIYARQSTFNSDASFDKTGSTNMASYGQNTFNGNTSITNSGTGYYRLASNAANDYNGNVQFTKSSSGAFSPAYSYHSTLAGNLSVNTNSTFYIASATGGWLEFDGTVAQSINNTGAANEIIIRRLMTNNANADITLNTPVTVSTNLNLTNGNLITTTTNILTMTDNSLVDAVSDNAYVAGPMKKIGNDAFTFPVGGTDGYGDSHYAAIGISAPSGATHSFTAEYHAAGHANATTFSAPLTKVSLVEYWDLARTIGTGNINVYLYWGDGTRSGIGNPTDLRVAHWDGATWEDKGNDGTSGSAASGGIAANGISTFSPFTFGTVDNVQNPLPIDLLNFDVRKEGHAVRIDWTTASEIDNDYFIIERTDDFKNIEVIQTVKGAGNSNEILNYYIYDNQPLNGTSYYRLTQVDYDGQQEVFDWKSVTFEENKEAKLSVYPNPSKAGKITIRMENIKGTTQVDVLDIAGRIIFHKTIELMEANNQIHLNLNLSAGVYFIRSTNNNNTLTQRLIVE